MGLTLEIVGKNKNASYIIVFHIIIIPTCQEKNKPCSMVFIFSESEEIRRYKKCKRCKRIATGNTNTFPNLFLLVIV